LCNVIVLIYPLSTEIGLASTILSSSWEIRSISYTEVYFVSLEYKATKLAETPTN